MSYLLEIQILNANVALRVSFAAASAVVSDLTRERDRYLTLADWCHRRPVWPITSSKNI